MEHHEIHGGINRVEVEKNLKGSDGNHPLQGEDASVAQRTCRSPAGSHQMCYSTNIKESPLDCVEHSAGRQRRPEKRAACSSCCQPEGSEVETGRDPHFGNSFKHNALFRSRSIVLGRGSFPLTVLFFRTVRNSLQHLRLHKGLT